MKLKNTYLRVIIIIIVSALSALVYNSLSARGINLIYKPVKLEPGANLIVEQAYQLLMQGNVLFIDTRYTEEYYEGHIPGAVNLPANASRDQMMDFLDTVNKEQIIVTYCSNPLCNSSQRLAGYLSYLGYQNAHIFYGGYEEWVEKKYPVQK